MVFERLKQRLARREAGMSVPDIENEISEEHEFRPAEGGRKIQLEGNCEEILQRKDFDQEDFIKFVSGLIELTGGTRHVYSNRMEYTQSRKLTDKVSGFVVSLRVIPPHKFMRETGVIIFADSEYLKQDVQLSLGLSLISEIIDEGKRPQYDSFLAGPKEIVSRHNRQLSWEEGKGMCERVWSLYEQQSQILSNSS